MKIAFLGDMVIDRDVRIDSEVSRFLGNAGCVIANLEGVILDKVGSASPFKTYGSVIYNNHDAVMRLIETVGITHVNLYNNHMIDYGEDQLERTLEILSKAGIKVLTQNSYLTFPGGGIQLSNSGLVETFGIYDVSQKFGQNINDMLFEKNPAEKWAGSIIHTHFGIEQVGGLSEYESQWFDHIAQFGPRIIIRHHPHCIQLPFQMHGVPCFPSIGDFAFNFNGKRTSKGLIVMFDVADSGIDCRTIECTEYQLHMGSEELDFRTRNAPTRLSKKECSDLRARYQSEYREDGAKSFKKAIKYFLGKEKSEHVLSMSSKHFIQPYVIGELL
jgi:poly-gamma-glutamate capsule biosynthesis protein CapA/YwtB (metallophosphatase superfamily)